MYEILTLKSRTHVWQIYWRAEELDSPLDPLPVGFRTWLWRYTFVVVNFDALAQASDIRIKRRQLSSSAECRIRNQSLRHQIASRLNARWQTDWTIKDQAKYLLCGYSLEINIMGNPLHVFLHIFVICGNCGYNSGTNWVELHPTIHYFSSVFYRFNFSYSLFDICRRLH